MTYFCWPIWKLASHWFPRQRADGMFEWDFGLSLKITTVTNTSLWHWHVLFSMMIFTDERHVCVLSGVLAHWCWWDELLWSFNTKFRYLTFFDTWWYWESSAGTIKNWSLIPGPHRGMMGKHRSKHTLRPHHLLTAVCGYYDIFSK